jgi:hypothetical protein
MKPHITSIGILLVCIVRQLGLEKIDPAAIP